MIGLGTLDLASRRMAWLEARQAAISQNVANASTPGYRPRDARSFESYLDARGVEPTRTASAHLSTETPGAIAAGAAAETWDTSLSGNSVSLDQELAKSAEVRSDYSATAAIAKTFNRMILAVAKG